MNEYKERKENKLRGTMKFLYKLPNISPLPSYTIINHTIKFKTKTIRKEKKKKDKQKGIKPKPKPKKGLFFI